MGSEYLLWERTTVVAVRTVVITSVDLHFCVVLQTV